MIDQKYIVDSCISCMSASTLSVEVPIFLVSSFLSLRDNNKNLLIISPSNMSLHGFVMLGRACFTERQALGLSPAA